MKLPIDSKCYIEFQCASDLSFRCMEPLWACLHDYGFRELERWKRSKRAKGRRR